MEEKNKICIIKKFIIAFTIIILFFSCITTSNVFAATYDLSDYRNCSLVGNKYVIIYSYDKDKIYLLTLERADFPYFICGISAESTSDKFITNGGWVSAQNNGSGWYYDQEHVKYYTFNYETSKFENRKDGGIGDGAFNPRKKRNNSK